MNEKNLEYLKDQVKYQGFGESLRGDLQSELEKGKQSFQLAYRSEINNRSVEATLHFKKSDTTDLYFFNKYDLRVQRELGDEEVSQTFYLNKGEGITLKEGYNLLNGRSVFKQLTDREDQKYAAWVQLDFSSKDQLGNYERKQFHDNYGYNLEKALAPFALKAMNDSEEKEKLLRSLQKGNLQMATVQTPTGEVKVFVEANPMYKTVNIYDQHLKRMGKDQTQELQQSAVRENKSEEKQVNIDQTEEKKKDKKELLKQADEGPLNSKKKTSRKKGMSL